jgi:hypothetical protein
MVLHLLISPVVENGYFWQPGCPRPLQFGNVMPSPPHTFGHVHRFSKTSASVDPGLGNCTPCSASRSALAFGSAVNGSALAPGLLIVTVLPYAASCYIVVALSIGG